MSPNDQTVVQQRFNPLRQPWSTLRLCGNAVPPLKLRPINHLESFAGSMRKTKKTTSNITNLKAKLQLAPQSSMIFIGFLLLLYITSQ